ncbi:MAG: LPS export ABC transporter permease LptG [Gammaproteobacteria bacterium]|nr:LPS export ABC transporter permease LptG [Gammaproteobacteria bacterium]
MVRKFDLYILRSLVMSMLVVLMCIIVLMSLFGFIDEARGTSETRGFLAVALLVVLSIPMQLSEMVPYVIFLGSVIGLGTLSSTSEITVLRVAGISQWRIAASASLAAVFFLVFMWIIAEYIGPRATELASTFNQTEVTTKVGRGYWYREGDVFTWFRDIGRDGRVSEIKQFEFDDHDALVRATRASNGSPLIRSRSWELHDVAETIVDAESSSTRVSNERVWKLESDFPSFRARVRRDPEDLSILDLHRHITYLKNEGLNSGTFEIALWSRLTTPVAVVGLVLVAVGFVLGPLRETGMGTRLTAGIGAGVFFGYLQQTMGPLALLYSLPPILGVVIPILLMLGVGIVLLRRLT